MDKFPVDAPKRRLIKHLRSWVLARYVKAGTYLWNVRTPTGAKPLLTMPNHLKIKPSTLWTICTQAGISRNDFLKAYEKA